MTINQSIEGNLRAFEERYYQAPYEELRPVDHRVMQVTIHLERPATARTSAAAVLFLTSVVASFVLSGLSYDPAISSQRSFWLSAIGGTFAGAGILGILAERYKRPAQDSSEIFARARLAVLGEQAALRGLHRSHVRVLTLTNDGVQRGG